MTRTHPSVEDVLPIVRRIYARHCAGCCLHILTDDGNCDQADADFVLAEARKRRHADCLAAAEMLAAMSTTQRIQVFHDW